MYQGDENETHSSNYGMLGNSPHYDYAQDPYLNGLPGSSSPSPSYRHDNTQQTAGYSQSYGGPLAYGRAAPTAFANYAQDMESTEYDGGADFLDESFGLDEDYPAPAHAFETRYQDPRSPPPHFASRPGPSHAHQVPRPRNAFGVDLVPVSSLPDVYRSIFKFGVFNAIQSQCYETAVRTNENMVISSPTGSGKTVLFELAIIRLLMQASKDAKCVYIAPTKALCTERSNDWIKKFQHIGVQCCELTGDTVETSKKAWNDARNSTIIVTTPEKWDSLTRNWRDHQEILSQMQLFLVDEVHILNELRGSTLEVGISRMKTRGTSVRFVLLSATAPNIEDIANWIGGSNGSQSARIFKFGEEYRPCKITRHVYSYSTKNQREFQFNRSLDFRVFDLLQRHACGKPVLIFCPTRNGVIGTAEQLAKDYQKALDEKKNLPWAIPSRSNRTFHDTKLNALLALGLGTHHAGMTMDDRRLTEELYLGGQIRTLAATSTLAVGVNLPAHTVVIKGTQMWAGSGWAEYSDLDVMQMLGRAGRPQFDNEGLAIIMCASNMEQRYKALTSGTTILESCLHLNLTEHLNSEVGLGTITSTESAKTWLHNSFLFQRLQRNPSHYALGKSTTQTWQERLDDLVSDSVKSLCDAELIRAKNDWTGQPNALEATEYGEIMSKYYIRYSTMGIIMSMPEKVGLRELIEALSQADEFSDIRLRNSDRTESRRWKLRQRKSHSSLQVYNTMKDHNDIRMTMKKIEKPADKVMVLIQAVLGGLPLNSKEFKTADSQPILEALGVFRHANRVARAIVDTAIVKRSGSQVKYGLELVRSLTAKAWDDRPIVLRQLPQIGEKSIKVLASSGITTIAKLRTQEPHRIEILLNRRPPFGSEVVAQAAALPNYTLKLSEESVTHSDGAQPVALSLSIEVGNIISPKAKKNVPLGWTSILTTTSDAEFIDFRRVPTKALSQPRAFSVTAKLEKPSQSVLVSVSSEQYAGLMVEESYRPKLPPTVFPTMKTKPKTELELDLDALDQDDPSIWTITEDEINDLTNDDPPSVVSSQQPRQPPTSSQRSDVPTILANGNHACNHFCKDKQGCRHLCCKEGIPKPPPSRAAKAQAAAKPPQQPAPPKPATSNTKVPTSVPKAKSSDLARAPKKAATTTNSTTKTPIGASTIRDLDHLHSSAKISSASKTFSSSDGNTNRRISLPKQAPPSRPRLVSQVPTFAPLESQEIPDDDDDLPDPDTMFDDPPPPALGSGSTSYSDPEMDALVAEIDLDEICEVGPPQPQKRRISTPTPTKGMSPPPVKKTRREVLSTIQPSKTKTTVKIQPAPPPIATIQRPLFLPSSPPGQTHDLGQEEMMEMEDDPFADEDDPLLSEPQPPQYPTTRYPATKAPAQIERPAAEKRPEEDKENALIAPGVERTGHQGFDNFLDWVYNSGDVELVD